METATQEAASIIATVDEYFAGFKDGAPPGNRPDTELVHVDLTLDQASFLWEKLYKQINKPSRMRPETIRKELLTVSFSLLEYLWDKLADMCPTTPFIRSRNGGVQFLKQGLWLQLRKHQAKYLLRIIKNNTLDKWDRENLERELFEPLQVAEIAEAGSEEVEVSDGVYRNFFLSLHHENSDAEMYRVVLKRALKELPRKLKMHPKSVKALLNAILEANGNVSKAARIVKQPQRKTDRRIQRILQHLKSRGFSA